MDDDTIEDFFASDEPLTVPDNVALDADDDRTVLTSAAPPEHDESPWPERTVRTVVAFASGTTRN